MIPKPEKAEWILIAIIVFMTIVLNIMVRVCYTK